MYSPREDSYFLSSELEKYLKNKNKNLKILDIGSGTGIQAETARKSGFDNILVSDIDEESVNYLKKRFKTIKSDLFEKIKGKFNLIIFNAPYLPENKYDKKKDTTGGKSGDETILRFLNQAKNHLEDKGRILLLLSSLTPKSRINKKIKNNFILEKTASKRIFFEIIEILFLSRKPVSISS